MTFHANLLTKYVSQIHFIVQSETRDKLIRYFHQLIIMSTLFSLSVLQGRLKAKVALGAIATLFAML